ncbi:MAG: UDP-N-acetylmuramate dehydrogenase [Chloroflexi bacterium]|nr:UDP-N-acetylmuramate dehydrogenase [Chloroflexota bacterium]
MSDPFTALEARFGEALRRDEPMARYTVARLGGPADALVTVRSRDELADAVTLAVESGLPWRVLGGGANVLVSDRGVRGLVIVNHAREATLGEDGQVWAESGTSFSTLARKAASRGLSGLEWAVNVPGTVGGAVVNNAGAHGGDVAARLVYADLLDCAQGRTVERWPPEQMCYDYRASALKGQHGRYVVLAAAFRLDPGHEPAAINARISELVAHRKGTQPPGASLGSMFKNPPGDYAGRLIEATGLKGTTVGGVQISPVHANFFINLGGGTAADYRALIELAQARVAEASSVQLELEIELLGDWTDVAPGSR